MCMQELNLITNWLPTVTVKYYHISYLESLSGVHEFKVT